MNKLADFDLSHKFAEISNISKDKNIVEKLPYIDPQQFKKLNDDKNHNYKANKKSNMYSVGILLWEISSSKRPFGSYKPYQKSTLMSEILNGKRETPISDKICLIGLRVGLMWPAGGLSLLALLMLMARFGGTVALISTVLDDPAEDCGIFFWKYETIGNTVFHIYVNGGTRSHYR
ncbi:kinase-like domain-containing protein [Rhizophagus clarus]|uniref:Kinase-like domain-containing protein n=1 Tax=Rhizophagus clarus TaxID=94130 RepID=A0A8H3R0W4_9GLOM|nr:kinase-like domain-containing protein [Rhizophagus clarus]